MKHLATKIIIIQLLFSFSLVAQNFILLENDASGDPSINGIVDLKSISYAIDESMDSLWFKLDLHTNVPGDLGIVFGIDTDLILDNGLNWDSPNNTDLLPEVVFTINRNFIDPSILYGFSTNNLNHSSTVGDNDSTIIVNMKLSNLDEDGQFNLVLGSSTFSCDTNNRNIYDDMPESGYLTINNISSSSTIYSSLDFDIFPNPAENQFHLNLDSNHQIESMEIHNSTGALIQRFTNISSNAPTIINCSDWAKGVYFLTTRTNTRINTARLIKN